MDISRGGAREGAGRKSLYGEEIKRIMISVPASKETEIRKKIDSILKKYLPKKSNTPL